LGGEDFPAWFDDMDEPRGLIAELIHCSALSLFLGGIEWQPGDRVLTLENEFPNQFYYANWLSERGVQMVEMAAITSIPERTRAIAISTVSYLNGARPDVASICRPAREAGALVYIDGTQSLGALQFDVAAVQPDMFAVDGYK
jgi:cysteine desulfurase/selenocysteine lyase